MEKSSISDLSRSRVATAHAAVTSDIRSAIVGGKLAAGTRLVQSELATIFEVSVTPVREALRDLTIEGLVDFDAFRGAVVHEPSVAELKEIYTIRAVLVPLAIAAGIREVTEDDLVAARSMIEQMEAEEDQGRWIELNRQFHHLLDGISRSPQLVRILAKLADLSALYVNLSLPLRPAQMRGADREHRKLVRAFERREVATAVELSLEHLNSTLLAATSKFATEAPASVASD